MTRPLKEIRSRCLDCSAGSVKEVRDCKITDCPLYPFRLGVKPRKSDITPLQAIKLKCRDCCCGSRKEVKICDTADCPIHRYRLGNPNMQRKNNYSRIEIHQILLSKWLNFAITPPLCRALFFTWGVRGIQIRPREFTFDKEFKTSNYVSTD